MPINEKIGGSKPSTPFFLPTADRALMKSACAPKRITIGHTHIVPDDQRLVIYRLRIERGVACTTPPIEWHGINCKRQWSWATKDGV